MSLQVGNDKITFADGSVMGSGWTGFKNRIINGDMRIDQRNAGSSVTPADGNYTLDRWRCEMTQSSKFTVQQNAGSVTPPTGYTKYLGVTSSSAYSVVSGDLFDIGQIIEGLNVADLGWGTANASTVTLSFWVRSSLTGTFGGALSNGSNRSYPFTYVINAANTWEQKTVTIAGDTTGTWGTTNSTGIALRFSLGCGSSQSGTAGAWAAANYTSATGATSVVGTNGATWYVTGVQLEKGSTATSFDYRPYGTELALCQRYYEKSYNIDTAPGSITAVGYYTFAGGTNAGGNVIFPIRWKVEKRAGPSITFYSLATGSTGSWEYGRSGSSGSVSMTADNIGTSGCRIYGYVGTTWGVGFVEGQYTVSAEL